jgi:hypothetical protein
VAAGAAVTGAAVAGAAVAGAEVAGAAVAGAAVGVAAGAQPVKMNANTTRAVIILAIFFISFFSSIKLDQIEVTEFIWRYF